MLPRVCFSVLGWVQLFICLGVSSALQKGPEHYTTFLSYNDASKCTVQCYGCIKKRDTGSRDAVECCALYLRVLLSQLCDFCATSLEWDGTGLGTISQASHVDFDQANIAC